jgi:hypothetical protein
VVRDPVGGRVFSKFSYHRRFSGNRMGSHRHRFCERITPVYAAPGGLARSVQVRRSPATETPFGRTSAYAAPTSSAGTTPTRSGSAPRPHPVDNAGSATASRNRVTVARTHPGHQRWTVPGGSFRGVATDVRCHRHRGTAPTAPGRGSGLAPPCLAARRSAGCGGLGFPRRGEMNVRGRRCGRSAVQPGQQRCAPGPST